MIKRINAFDRLRNMFIGVCPLSSSWVILSTNSRTANSVEVFFLKPY